MLACLDRRDERLELQYFRGTTLLHSFKNALISDAITSCFINVKPTFKSYQPDHSMVSSKFNPLCLAPTDNSLTKTFLLLLHFLVFCAFIITPHFHLSKRFLTFIFSKFESMFYIHQKMVHITHIYPQFLIIFLSSQFHLHIQLNYCWIQLLYDKESKSRSYYVLQSTSHCLC